MSNENTKLNENAPKGLDALTCSASIVKVMCQAYQEMNVIRARDGVPYMHNGYKSDVSQEYWDSIMDKLDEEVENATGRKCWLHPSLNQQNV